MNSVNPKFNWISFVSALGILFGAIALGSVIFAIYAAGFGGNKYRLYSDALGSTFLLTWFAELICGIILLRRRKITGIILIALWFLVLILCLLIPATARV
jgi:hypothetical protein